MGKSRFLSRRPPRPAVDRFDPYSRAPDTEGYTITHTFSPNPQHQHSCRFCGMVETHPNHQPTSEGE